MTTKQNFDQIKTLVSRRADNVTNAGKTLAGGFANEIIEVMAEERDWTFFRIRETALTMQSGIYEYDLPATFERADKVFYKESTGKFQELYPMTDDNWFDSINEENPGTPRFYRYISQDPTNQRPKIQLGPPPGPGFLAQYGTTLYVEMYKDVSTLVEGNDYPDFPPRFHKIIGWGAAGLMCTDQGDQIKGDRFYAIYQRLLDRRILLDKNRFRKQLTIPVQPCSTIYPHRCGVNLGAPSDYGS